MLSVLALHFFSYNGRVKGEGCEVCGCSEWRADCVTVDQCNSSPADAGQIELKG